MGRVVLRILDNPVLGELLAMLRDKNTPSHVFREAMEQAGVFIGYEIARDLGVAEYSVETPLGVARGVRPRDEGVVLVAVLRAALPLAFGLARVLRRARMGFVWARRVEESARPRVEVYHASLPPLRGATVVVVDPMLATASTVLSVASLVTAGEPSALWVASLIASRPGLERLDREAPLPVRVYTLAVDPVLDERGFIVPGLGDAGDRAFATP